VLNLRYRQHGFTLIELMIGLVIMGTLFALAIPSFRTWIQNQQIRTGAESILNGIQLARSTAVNNNGKARLVLCELPYASWEILAESAAASGVAVAVSPSPGGCKSGSLAGVAPAPVEIRVQEYSRQVGASSAQVTVTPPGAYTVTFNNLGRVVANNDITVVPADVTITSICVKNPLVADTRYLQINLEAGGAVRMCDPTLLTKGLNADPRGCNDTVNVPPC
jgi:type IV fimbrial biogenesis protein FimT